MKTFMLLLLIASPIFAADCKEKPITLSESNFKVQLSFYPRDNNPQHIIIMPPTGGVNLLDRSWARNLCAAGFNAHIVEHWTGDDEYALDFGIHQRFYERTQKAIGMVLNHLSKAQFIGILGTSIGGVHAGMTMGLHPRIDAAFVIAGGADMPTMIANSDQDLMVETWKKRKQQFNLPDKASYIKLLHENIKYDALKLPRNFEGKKLGMVISKDDSTVPYENQVKLRELWKPQTVINYSLNHFWTIVFSWLWDTNEVIDFFIASAPAHANL